MKFAAIILSLFILNTTFASDEVKVKNKINEVTIFFKGAQVFRKGVVKIPKGTSKVVFSDVSPLINPKSLQASSINGVDILDVKHRVVHPNPDNDDIEVPSSVIKNIEKYNDTLTRHGFKQKRINQNLSDLRNEKNLLVQSKLMANKERDTLPELQSAMKYYRKQLADIEAQIEKEEWKSYLAQKKEQKLRAKLNEYTNYRDNQMKDLPALRIIHEVVVTIDASAATEVKMELNYLVSNAGWLPSYDLRADKTNKELDLTYKASVYQHTGEDWTNVKLSLSTFNYDISGKLPELRKETLSFKDIPKVAKQQKSGKLKAQWSNNFSNQVTYETSQLNMAPTNMTSHWNGADNSYTMLTTDFVTGDTASFKYFIPGLASRKVETFKPRSIPEYRFINESYINTKFSIKRRYDIASDAKETIVIIKENQVTADYAYYLIPKEDNNAFLVTSISDWEELNLLKANANIYMSNTFVGETGVDPSLISDTMQLSLGRDQGIYCVRKKVMDETKTPTLGKNLEHKEQYEITIKNSNSMELNLFVKDQIPVTTDEDIEISLINSSKAEFDEESGELLWEIDLKQKQKKTLKFGFTVTYDKDKKLAAIK